MDLFGKVRFSKFRFPKKSDFSAPKGRPVIVILIGFLKNHVFGGFFRLDSKVGNQRIRVGFKGTSPSPDLSWAATQITLLMRFSVFYKFWKKLKKHEKA